MRKWELTDAAIKRIEKRIIKLRQENDDYCFEPWKLVLHAMKPENYAKPHDAAEGLIKYWMREGRMLGLCTQCFESYCYERKELREAGNNIMKGIRAFGRMKL